MIAILGRFSRTAVSKNTLLLVLVMMAGVVSRLPAPILEGTPAPATVPTAPATVPIAPAQLPETKSPPTIPSITSEIAARIESKFSPWMPPRAFNQFIDRQMNAHLFPLLIEGRLLQEGKREFRAIFEKYPVPQFRFYTEWNNRPLVYEQKKAHLIANGFEILSQQTFEDPAGAVIFETVFVPKSQMPAAKQSLGRVIQ